MKTIFTVANILVTSVKTVKHCASGFVILRTDFAFRTPDSKI